MKTIRNITVQGQVQSIETANNNDYIVQFVIKTIREGDVAWFNVTAAAWSAWNVKTGDEVALTGELTSTVWKDPFKNEEFETFEMKATSLKLAV